jgi:putative ABC transport system ATP-binding protein
MDDQVVLSATKVSRAISTPVGRRTVLAPTTFELSAGELVVVAGPSGSGKTTLCNILAGWEPTDTGVVRWAPLRRDGWGGLAVVPQRLALLRHLTIVENISLPAWAEYDEIDEQRLDTIATALAIDGLLDRLPNEISFGEQQRSAVARALLGEPVLAILDEPTGHQDEARTSIVVDELLAARSRGTCVLVASHDPKVIDAADRVIELRPVLH